MKLEARLSEARFGRLPSSIDEPGVDEDVLVFKNTGWRGVADEGEKNPFKPCARKPRHPYKTRMLGPCSPKGGRILNSFVS